MSNPLHNIEVLELPGRDSPLVHRIAIAFAAKIAADLGANVTRLTLQDTTLFPKSSFASLENQKNAYAVEDFLDTGKNLESFDYTRQENRDAFLQSLSRADVIVSDDINTLPDNLKELVSEKIICSLSSYQKGHPNEGQPVSELVLLAQSGLLNMIGDPNREPLMLGGHQASYASGLALFSAMMTGLLDRIASGKGDIYDVDILNVLTWVNWKSVCASQFGSRTEVKREGQASEWRVVRAKDGWVALVFNQGDWKALVKMVGHEDLMDNDLNDKSIRATRRSEYMKYIEAWCIDKTKQEISELAQKNRIPIGAIYKPSDLSRDAQISYRGTIIDFLSKSGLPSQMPALPALWNEEVLSVAKVKRQLDQTKIEKSPYGNKKRGSSVASFNDLRVLDLGIITAGAATSALLADVGCDVVKVESKTKPDPFRKWEGDVQDKTKSASPFFDMTNRNKRGLGLDLKKPDGKELFLELVKNSDVIVENFRRGVLQRLGISFEELIEVNPQIVLASISSQGETGPERMSTSYGSTLEATGGLAAVTGYFGEQPTISGRHLNYPDQVVSLFSMGIIVAAVMDARETGRGVHLDISQRELTMYLLGEYFGTVYKQGDAKCSLRMGNMDLASRAQCVAMSRDSVWVAATLINDASTDAVREIIGVSDKSIDISAALKSWISKSLSDEAVLALQAVGVAASVVLTGREVFKKSEKSGSYCLYRTLDGDIVKGFPFLPRNNPYSINMSAPGVGRDTTSVVSSWGSISQEKITELLNNRVLFV